MLTKKHGVHKSKKIKKFTESWRMTDLGCKREGKTQNVTNKSIAYSVDREEKLKRENIRNGPDNTTRTEIIIQNSLDGWSFSDKVLKLYRNAQALQSMSSDSFHSVDNKCENYSWLSNTTLVSCPDLNKVRSITKQNKQNRFVTKKKNTARFKQNFIKTNKDLTKFILKGRQKINLRNEKSCCKRSKKKRRIRHVLKHNVRTKEEGDGEKQATCSDSTKRELKKKQFNKTKLNKKPADIIITDILYLL